MSSQQNMLTPDICIIGAGSGGLSVAAAASQMGADVVLIEKGKMGGDCLNYGCVPSKALLAAAKIAHTSEVSSDFGVIFSKPEIDFKKVMAHVQGVIDSIAPHDSVARFESLGVNVIQEKAIFESSSIVRAGDTRIKAKRIIIATGSRAFVPPIQGLGKVPYLTNETVFEQQEKPEHLVIIGGGPIGMEMAQAHVRLGCKVSVVDQKVMPHDDPELVDVVKNALIKDGVTFHEGHFVDSVEKDKTRMTIKTANETIEGTHLLVAAGRVPNIDDLGLSEAGIDFTRRGIEVNARLQTSQKHIYAIGDCAGQLQFTHVAGYHAGIIIQNCLFRFPAKADLSACPWVTYTDPELAHVGLTEKTARDQGLRISVSRFDFKDNDRAVAERRTDGFAKIISDQSGKILGASVVGKGAGELILPWVLALQNKWKLSKMAAPIVPYPTRSEISKRAAGSFYTPKLYSKLVKTIVRFLFKYL